MLLNGNYIAGFVDGEGCFTLLGRYYLDLRDVKYRFRFTPRFQIKLKNNDIDILTDVLETIGTGNIRIDDRFVWYYVQGIKGNKKIIEFFEKYPLQARKKEDFKTWKEIVIILEENDRKKYSIDLMNKILELRDGLNKDSHTSTRKSREEIMRLWEMNPYGMPTVQGDQKVEACVNSMLASSDFKPDLAKYGHETRKVAAIRICKAEVLGTIKRHKK